MRALTVQQPWAWAIIHGGKLVENRTTSWAYRGRLAIHAGQRLSMRGQLVISDAPMALTYGAIIGTVDLVDVHPDAGCCRPWGESTYTEHRGRARTNVHHLVLEDPRPCQPIPTPGRLGLWTVPADVAAQLEQPQLAPFTCPACGATSHHPDDQAHGYCGQCHAFTAPDPTCR